MFVRRVGIPLITRDVQDFILLKIAEGKLKRNRKWTAMTERERHEIKVEVCHPLHHVVSLEYQPDVVWMLQALLSMPWLYSYTDYLPLFVRINRFTELKKFTEPRSKSKKRGGRRTVITDSEDEEEAECGGYAKVLHMR